MRMKGDEHENENGILGVLGVFITMDNVMGEFV